MSSHSTISGGESNEASGDYSTVSGGESNTASNVNSTVSGGQDNTASGDYSTVSGGESNTASNVNSTVSGGYTNTASGQFSTVSGGRDNIASGIFYPTVSGGQDNRALGQASTVSGGQNNRASGDYSTVSGGESNEASGDYSTVAGGRLNITAGNYSGTLAGRELRTPFPHSTAVGRYNLPGTIGDPAEDRLFMVGYGGSLGTQSNRFSITTGGNAYISGNYHNSGADFGEYFESLKQEKIPIGTSITRDKGRFIRPAREGDIPFGVVSNTCGYVGNNGEEWHGKYQRDEDGNYIYEIKDELLTKKLSPLFDPSKEFIPRQERPEWNLIGLVGQVKILKGQVVAPQWIYLDEISSKYDFYLIK